MNAELNNKLDNLNSAVDGQSIKNSLISLFTNLLGVVKNGGFAAKYLDGVLASDFLTKKDMYEYFTNGLYLANSFDNSDRTSGKAMSTGLFENSFGNATELFLRFDYDYGIQKGK